MTFTLSNHEAGYDIRLSKSEDVGYILKGEV